jgi:hypothetical protein
MLFLNSVHEDGVASESTPFNKTGIFNMGTGTTRSFMDVARDVALLYNAKLEIVAFPEHLKLHYQTYTCAG